MGRGRINWNVARHLDRAVSETRGSRSSKYEILNPIRSCHKHNCVCPPCQGLKKHFLPKLKEFRLVCSRKKVNANLIPPSTGETSPFFLLREQEPRWRNEMNQLITIRWRFSTDSTNIRPFQNILRNSGHKKPTKARYTVLTSFRKPFRITVFIYFSFLRALCFCVLLRLQFLPFHIVSKYSKHRSVKEKLIMLFWN